MSVKDNFPSVKPNYMNIDTIGVIYEKNDDPEAEPVPMEGWHINVRVLATEDVAPLQPFSIDPQPYPIHVWA